MRYYPYWHINEEGENNGDEGNIPVDQDDLLSSSDSENAEIETLEEDQSAEQRAENEENTENEGENIEIETSEEIGSDALDEIQTQLSTISFMLGVLIAFMFLRSVFSGLLK